MDIHPFLDGNGRVGRLLITLLLSAKGALSEPLLYPSLFFKTHRSRYYELLQRVRTDGAWEEWLGFFLEGVASMAREAGDTADRTLKLFARDRSKIEKLGRASASALRVHELMQTNPYLRIPTATKVLKLTVPTVTSALNHLMELDIVKEVSGRPRDRLFAFSQYLRMVSGDTQPL
jgi:Fic family protein